MVDKLTISGVVFTLIVFLQVMWGCNNKNYNDAAAPPIKEVIWKFFLIRETRLPPKFAQSFWPSTV